MLCVGRRLWGSDINVGWELGNDSTKNDQAIITWTHKNTERLLPEEVLKNEAGFSDFKVFE
jgi:hypothetical protein